jgi:NADPH:quinone reductase and related Zn-dependent oxidoreductases
MTRVVRFHRTGGPEVLQIDNVHVPAPGPGEVQIRIYMESNQQIGKIVVTVDGT